MSDRSGTGAHADGSATGSTGSTGSRSTGVLDATLVSQVERALATHIGPLARHLVSRDLARSGSVEDLSRSLARHITDAPEREQFIAMTAALAAAAASAADLDAERGTSGSGTVRRTILVDAFPAQHAPASASTSASTHAATDKHDEPDALSDTYLRAVTEALAAQLGPIARLMVQQAARGAADRPTFLDRLQDTVPEAAPLVADLRDGHSLPSRTSP